MAFIYHVEHRVGPLEAPYVDVCLRMQHNGLSMGSRAYYIL